MEYFQDNDPKVLVHQMKIGDVFFQVDDSTLLDNGGNDIIQMQIPHLLSFIEARSHAGAMSGLIIGNLTFLSCYN
jgi:hypothetical protein